MNTVAAVARVRRYPLFFGGLALGVLAALGGSWVNWRLVQKWRRGAEELARLRIEQLTPQPRAEMVATAQAELAGARERLRQERAAWPGVREETAPDDPLAAYAELAALTERMRAAAQAAGVATGKDERFGFAQFAHEAPAAAELPAVAAQRRVVERVLTLLFAAAPERLVSVGREFTGAGPAPAGEWCTLEAARSLRLPGLVHTRVVRVAFVGSTTAFRHFLNRLATEPALLVRDMSVALVDEKREREPGAGAGGTGVRRYAVTIEAAEVVGGFDTPVGPGAELAAVWPDPAGPERTGELFAPGRWRFEAARRVWTAEADPAASGGVGDCGLVLVAVRAPVRWRLLGGAGEGATASALIEDSEMRRSFRLRVGEVDARSGVGLQALDFGRAADGGRVLKATLRPAGAAEPLTVAATEVRRGPRPTALLRLSGSAELREVQEGAVVQVAGAHFRIGAIRSAPATVAVTRLAPDGRAGEVWELAVAEP